MSESCGNTPPHRRHTHRSHPIDRAMTRPETQRQKRTGPKGRPGAGGCLVSINYFFSSSIAALALSAATDDFPASNVGAAWLTGVRGYWMLCHRGDWMSWLRGDWMSWLRGDWM